MFYIISNSRVNIVLYKTLLIHFILKKETYVSLLFGLLFQINHRLIIVGRRNVAHELHDCCGP